MLTLLVLALSLAPDCTAETEATDGVRGLWVRHEPTRQILGGYIDHWGMNLGYWDDPEDHTADVLVTVGRRVWVEWWGTDIFGQPKRVVRHWP